jgi:hypothetical protein
VWGRAMRPCVLTQRVAPRPQAGDALVYGQPRWWITPAGLSLAAHRPMMGKQMTINNSNFSRSVSTAVRPSAPTG